MYLGSFTDITPVCKLCNNIEILWKWVSIITLITPIFLDNQISFERRMMASNRGFLIGTTSAFNTTVVESTWQRRRVLQPSTRPSRLTIGSFGMLPFSTVSTLEYGDGPSEFLRALVYCSQLSCYEDIAFSVSLGRAFILTIHSRSLLWSIKA